MSRIDEIVEYWLGVGPEGWYSQSDAVDQEIRNRFFHDWEKSDTLAEQWGATAKGSLASLILTDQFPRNMFRGDPRSFATDSLALKIADRAIAQDQDLEVGEPERQFFYLPFEHSEELADQERAVDAFQTRMPDDQYLHHAKLHRDTIAKFGRFPWRNEALGRESTKAEMAILEAGGYGALADGRVSLADFG